MPQNSVKQNTPGYVHSLESFGLVDGPGVRFVVFMQGCRMRCQYCHNPETWKEKAGKTYMPDELFRHVYRYHNYWKNNGGITVSGGEPLLQIDFVTEFFRLAHEKGIHTALDTSGNPFSMRSEYLKKFDELLNYTSLFILDIKEIDPEKHRKLTGFRNDNILEMARYLSDHGVPMWIRHVLVPGLTDEEEGLRDLDRFIRSLSTVRRVEILPYHTMGLSKWRSLQIAYPLEGTRIPTEEEVTRAEEILHIRDYPDFPG